MKTQSELKLERFSVNSSGIVERMKGQIRGSGRVSPSFIGNVQFTHIITSVRDLIERLVTDGGKESKSTGEKYIVLPTLQREFLWGPEKIEDLFDSLLRGYPVGSLLLWKPSTKTANDEAKYKFIRHYVGRSNFPLDEVEKPVRHHSKQLSYSPSTDSFFFALDGQQRLTSFLIGLRGSYFDHRYRKHTDKRESYYEKELCLNLAQNPLRERDAREHIYDFQFREKKSLGDKQFEYNRDKQEYWWPISKIWNAKTEQKLKETTTEAIGLYPGQETEVHEYIKQNISQLYQAINGERIPCEITSQMESRDAVELFYRRNKGGIELSNADYAFSLITVYWDEFNDNDDPKEVFEEKSAELTEEFSNYSFEFGKGFLIRALLYISGEKPSFAIENLTPETIKPLEDKWGKDFFETIRATFHIITEDLGLTSKCLGNKTSLLPILYYCSQRKDRIKDGYLDVSGEELNRMKYWLELTVFNNFLSNSSVTRLYEISKLFKETEHFPIEKIIEENRDRPIQLEIDADRVEELVGKKELYQKTHIRNYLLTSLYEDRGVGRLFMPEGSSEVCTIEVDHFFPKDKLKDEGFLREYISDKVNPKSREYNKVIEFSRKNKNRFGNLQLLPQGSGGNQSKGKKNPEKWLGDENRQKKINTHFLPENISEYTYDKYREFCKKRESKLVEKLQEKLMLKEDINGFKN